jgi:uncharacterized protein YidB (DUF937 family)
MTALLGLIAMAGYQNRDKLAELFRGATATNRGTSGQAPQPDSLGGLLGGLGAGGVGAMLSNGLNELVDRFKKSGFGDIADSWVGRGPNKEVAPSQVEQAIGSDTLATLSQQTGLSREEIVARLSRELPPAVDKYTPDGKLPA